MQKTFLSFIRNNFLIELKQSDSVLFNLNDLENIFIKYLPNENILRIVIDSLVADEKNKTFHSLLPYLAQLWIIEELELNKKVLKEEQNKIIQYFELIKSNYSEQNMLQLINAIKLKCHTKNIIPQDVIDLLKKISNNDSYNYLLISVGNL